MNRLKKAHGHFVCKAYTHEGIPIPKYLIAKTISATRIAWEGDKGWWDGGGAWGYLNRFVQERFSLFSYDRVNTF